MVISTLQINGIWTKIYKAAVPTDLWVLWLHGLGEESSSSVTNGSQIDKIELYDSSGNPVSWTASARKGYEFPFNIIAPQIDNSQYSDWWKLTNGPAGNEAWFLNYIKESLKASKIIVTGYSLGGRGTWGQLFYDKKGYINAIAPVCGYYDSSLGPIANLRTVPGYSVHGDKDTTMNYQWDADTIKLYNQGRPTQVITGTTQPCHYLKTLAGQGHSVWPTAYGITANGCNLLNWVIAQFGISATTTTTAAPTTTTTTTTTTQAPVDPIVSTAFDGVNLIYITASGRKIVVSPISIS